MRELLSKLCDAGLVRPACEVILGSTAHPSSKLRNLFAVTKRVRDPGALWGTPCVDEIQALLSSDTLPPEDVERARDVLQPLLGRRGDETGVAAFPVAIEGLGVTGTVLHIRAGHDLATPRSVRGSDLERSVVRARDLAADRLTCPELLEASWTIEPAGACVDVLDGASIGLAAYAAFVSLARGVPLPANRAFTGILDDGATSWRCPSKLDEKRAALADRPQVRELCCPAIPEESTFGLTVDRSALLDDVDYALGLPRARRRRAARPMNRVDELRAFFPLRRELYRTWSKRGRKAQSRLDTACMRVASFIGARVLEKELSVEPEGLTLPEMVAILRTHAARARLAQLPPPVPEQVVKAFETLVVPTAECLQRKASAEAAFDWYVESRAVPPRWWPKFVARVFAAAYVIACVAMMLYARAHPISATTLIASPARGAASSSMCPVP